MSNGTTKDEIPEECLSPRQRYENAVRKSCIFAKIVKDRLIDFTGLESLGYLLFFYMRVRFICAFDLCSYKSNGHINPKNVVSVN